MGIITRTDSGLSYCGAICGIYHKTYERQIEVHRGHNNYCPGCMDLVQDVLYVKNLQIASLFLSRVSKNKPGGLADAG